jgi:drug/metabolite transporter (DMT)-like permease
MLVLARSVSDVFAEGFKMRAFANGDISLVTSFLALSPLFLAFLSPYITGDRVTTHDYVALAFIVVGSLMIVRRDKDTGKVFQLRAVVYALLASLAFALNSCFDRLAVVQSGALVSGFAMTLMAAVFCIPVAFRHHDALPQLSTHAKPFLVRGAWETLFMVSKLFAMTMLEAHVVLGISRISLILTVLAGKAMFGERDTGRRLLAAGCMYAGLLVLFLGHV